VVSKRRILIYFVSGVFICSLAVLIAFTAWRSLRARQIPQPVTSATLEAPEFEPSLRACGMGYAQMYLLRDGRKMGEGTVCETSARATQKQWRKLLATATNVIERVPNYKNRFGDSGERVVAWFPANEFGPESAQILWYGGGNCYSYISAPTFDIALQFERANAYVY
jgi:hypothetical protein